MIGDDRRRLKVRIGTDADAKVDPVAVDRLADRILAVCDELEANTVGIALGSVLARVCRAACADDVEATAALARLFVETGFEYDAADAKKRTA